MLKIKPREPSYFALFVFKMDEDQKELVDKFIKDCEEELKIKTDCFAVFDEEQQEIIVQSEFGSIETRVKRGDYLVFKYVPEIPYFEFTFYNSEEFSNIFHTV
mgnify:CR=1 FL=1